MDDGLVSPNSKNALSADENYLLGLGQSEVSVSSRSAVPQATSFATTSNGHPDQHTLPTSHHVQRTSQSLDVSHASPLAPLRARDSQALDEMFECDRLNDITLDIHRYLARTYPEPCWEDEPYEFLNDYI